MSDEEAFQTRHESEADVNRPENKETEDMDTRYLGKKMREIEYDDNRN